MNPEMYKQITSRAPFLKGAVESFEMFDELGNCCAAALFRRGANEWELCLWEFNTAVHKCERGSLALLKNKMDLFFYAKEKAGFIPPTVSPITPEKINP